MATNNIRKSIDINAPKERVWDVLLLDKYSRIWYAPFSEGAYAETDWKVGSKAIFKDPSNSGMIGRVTVNDPYEKVSVVYEGILMNGVEDYESEGAKQVKGGSETYTLSGDGNTTHLAILGDMGEGDMGDSFMEMMSAAWEKALQIIKDLSEKNDA